MQEHNSLGSKIRVNRDHRQLPKILFCTSEIPQSINAGSMQLFRVLQGYPGDRLMVLGMPPESGAQLLPSRYETLKLLTYRLACTRFRSWFSGINALNLLPEHGLSRSFNLVHEFGPDLVVTVMDKLSYYKHAWALAGKLSAGLVTITMDDPQTFERAHPFLEDAFVRFLRRMYNDAVLSLGVSTEMCDYIKARFGRPTNLFYFGPPEGMLSRPPQESLELKSSPKLTLGYAGSLGLGYREGLTAILETLSVTNTRLLLYTRDQHCFIEHPQIINRGFMPPEKLWPTVQAECDAVVLPYSFESQIGRVYRTHFPTKLSEYCWIGMPMVLVGPDYATGIRWGKRNSDAALTATDPRPDTLAPVLEQLREDAPLRARMARRGAEIARSDFDPVQIKKKFVSLLCEAAAAGA